MAVKENEITKLVADLNAAGWFRVVDENGLSKDLLKTLLTLPISQIVGLTAALAAKAGNPTVVSQGAFVKASGAVNGSGEEIKQITTEAHMNLAFNGRYNFPAGGLELFPYGYVYSIVAWDDSVIGESAVQTPTRTNSGQLIFASNGIFYRKYVTAWGAPIYMGGSTANYTGTYAEIQALVTAENLTPGQTYRITGHGNDNGIILQAATATTFYSDGIRLGLVPAHYIAGTYSTVVWIGVWRIGIGDAGVDTGNKTVFMGRVWENRTGNIGTVHPTDQWSLDATNWILSADAADYTSMVFGCTYDIASDYISKQWDGKGNVFGETITSDSFLIEYNDWNIDTGAENHFYNNELSRCYNNKIDGFGVIYHNKGGGKLYSNNINGGFYAGVVGMFIDYAANVRSNTLTTCFLSGSVMNGNNIEDQAFTASTKLRIDFGKIVASLSLNAGTFTIAAGSTYLAKTIATGMTITTVRKNGVTVSGQTLVAQYAGWHRVKATMSLTSPDAYTLESTIFVNSTDAGLPDSVLFVTGESRRVEIDNYVLLSVGDIVSIRHRHNYGSTVTFTHLSSSFTLDYDN